jgi:hypothetical protein
MEDADRASALGAPRRARCPFHIGIQQVAHPRAQIRELPRRQVHEVVPELRSLLPFTWLSGATLEPTHHPLEVAFGDHARQQLRRGIGLGVVGDRGPLREQCRCPPRAFAPLPARRLLDEPVLGELAQMERAARGALAEELPCTGGGGRTLPPKQADQGEASRVRNGPQGPRIGELDRAPTPLPRHDRKISFERSVVKSWPVQTASRAPSEGMNAASLFPPGRGSSVGRAHD